MKLKDAKIGTRFITTSGNKYIKKSNKDNLEFDLCLPINRDLSEGGLRLVSSIDYVRISRNAEIKIIE